MKKVLLVMSVFTSFLISAQEIEKVEKIKIGKYEYEIFLDTSYNVERNFQILSYLIKLGNHKQNLGSYLVYRETGSSKKYLKKVDEKHPPDLRSFLKDGIILSKGAIDIDEKNKVITIIDKTLNNDEDYESEPDSTKRVYKQRKDGFFDLILIAEYRNDKEKIVFEK